MTSYRPTELTWNSKGLPSPSLMPGRQYLNAADRLMLVAHSGLRHMGHPGFQCQTHIWLDGRVDVARLRSALTHLNASYPVVTSRLNAANIDNRPYWSYRTESEVDLMEMDAADESALRRYAEELSATALDLDRHDPVSFHLLHLPDGRDVFLFKFSHVLMDGKAPELALREINRCFHEAALRPEASATGEPNGPSVAGNRSHFTAEPSNPCGTGLLTGRETSPTGETDEMAAHLARFDRGKRWRAALRVIGTHIGRPVKFVTLDPPDLGEWRFLPFRLAVRTLDEDQTQQLTTRVKRLCGFANLAPAVLGCVFRVISRLTPHKHDRRSVYQTEVPLNLRPPGRLTPVFHNFMSFISLRARGTEVTDRDALNLQLNVQMRDQLRRGIDLGNLQMMAVMAPRARLLAKHLLARMKSHPFSLGFGYQGPVVEGLERFCGQPVQQLYTLNAAGSPPGITLQVNQCRGRLNLCVTYVSSGVPDALAERFLEELADDLTR